MKGFQEKEGAKMFVMLIFLLGLIAWIGEILSKGERSIKL